MIDIDCKYYDGKGRCTNGTVRRSWFGVGPRKCVVVKGGTCQKSATRFLSSDVKERAAEKNEEPIKRPAESNAVCSGIASLEGLSRTGNASMDSFKLFRCHDTLTQRNIRFSARRMSSSGNRLTMEAEICKEDMDFFLGIMDGRRHVINMSDGGPPRQALLVRFHLLDSTGLQHSVLIELVWNLNPF